MTRLWRRGWLPVLLVGMLILGLLSALHLAGYIGRPYAGFFTFYKTASGSWPLDIFVPRWWPVISQYGLDYNDTFVTLNGQPFGFDQGEKYATAAAQQETSVEVTVQRGTSFIQQALPLVTFTFSDYLDIKVPLILNGLGFWLLAVTIYSFRPTVAINRVFAVTGCLLAGYHWLLLPSLFERPDLIDQVMQLVWVVSTSLLGVLFFHCTILFPVPLKPTVRSILKVWYGVSIALAACYVGARVLQWTAGPLALTAALDTLGFRGSALNIGLGFAMMLGVFSWTYFHRSTSTRVKCQVGLILASMVIASMVVFTAMIGALNGSMNYFIAGLDLRCLHLAPALAFAYVIWRYQTFRGTPPPLFVAVVILLSSALLASVGDWLLRALQPQTTHSQFMPLFLIAVAASALWSAQGLIQRTTQRFFHWEETSYRAAKRFSQDMTGQTDFSAVPAAIVQALVSDLKLEQAVIYLWDATANQFVLMAQAQPAVKALPQSVPRFSGNLADFNHPIRLDQDESAWLEPLRATTSLEAAAVLWGAEEPIGLLGLGKRWDEEVFHDRDLEIVELIAQQSALFLLTARQIDELKQMPRRVSEAQERERFKIAQELHDTIQQFLGRLPFFLEVSRATAHRDPDKADALLRRCIEDVEQAARTVRQIRAALAPFQLQTSLVGPLDDLLERFQTRQGLAVHSTLAPEIDQALSLEERHALYRVIQQALDNAAAHAQAAQVSVKAWCVDSRVQFEVTDDGVGCSDVDRSQAEARGSFGLKSMRDRIEAQGGEFEIVSRLTVGTTIRGWLPAQVLVER
jgi:signal transduction histidine kinase